MENVLKPEFRLPKDYSDPRFQTGYEMLPAKSRFASVKAYVLSTLHALLALQWDDVSLTHLTDPEMIYAKEQLRKKFVEDDFLKNTL